MNMIAYIATRMARQSSHAPQIPGPQGIFRRASMAYQLWRDPLRMLCALEAEYPELAWIPTGKGAPFPGICFIFSPGLARRVLVDDARAYRLNDFIGRLRIVTGDGLLTSEGPFWLRQRRLTQPAFSRKNLGPLVRFMIEEVEKTVARWARIPEGVTVDLKQEMARLSLNVVARALFSEDLGNGAAAFSEATEVALSEVFGRAMKPFILPSYVPTLSNRRLNRAVGQVDETVMRIIRARRGAASRPQDLLTLWMDTEDPETGERMTDQQLRDEAVTMFVAGHETCTMVLTWAFYLLARHPAIQSRLHAEARDVLGDRSPTLEDLRQLRYTRQVFYETLRLFPQPWILGRMAVDDTELGGHIVPKGAFVAVATYAIHHSTRHWPNPERFDPERFASDHLPPTFLPFGLGARRCVGEHFGTFESQLALAMITRRFSLSLRPGHPAVGAVGEVSLHPAETIHLCVRARVSQES